MRNTLKFILNITLALLILIPNISTLAATEEKVTQIRTLYWDVWKHADGNWQETGKPGDSRSNEIFSLDMPDKFTNGYSNIRVEVKNGSVSETDNNDPTLEAQYKKDWDIYTEKTLGRSANITNRSISGTNVSLSFSLPEPPYKRAEDIKASEEAKGRSFSKGVEGWRYYLPVTVYWYGSKEETELPDMYVKEIKTTAKETEGGKVYNATVTYGMKGPFEGKAPGKIGLTHNGYSITPIDGQRLSLSQWEEKAFDFTFTGQKGKDSVLEAKIWPDAGDKDWSNNSKKLVVPQKADFDLEAYLQYVSVVESGTTERLTGWLYNKTSVPIVSSGVWRVNGKVVKTVSNVKIPANEGILTAYDFSIPAGTASGIKYKVELEVNPNRNQPSVEKTWSNNKSSGTIEALLVNKGGRKLKGTVILE